jgi:AraC-like DNA-binding protein
MMYPSIELVHACLDTTRDLPSLGLFPRPVLESPPLVARFRSLHQCFLDGDSTLDHEEGLVNLLHDLFARHALHRARAPHHRRPSAAVRIARDYIEAHATSEVIRLSTLTALTGVGPFRLIRLFNRTMGLSPYAYVKQLRVRRAQVLLQAGFPVVQAAYAGGFSDQSHLTRMFKSVLGMTPGMYARAVRRASCHALPIVTSAPYAG